jgi:hypothetical protein
MGRPVTAFNVYPHTMDGGHDCIIDGEGTIRMLWELDALAWNKALTDAELAAEYHANETDAWRMVARRPEFYDLGLAEKIEQREVVLRRFATLPHYDETP